MQPAQSSKTIQAKNQSSGGSRGGKVTSQKDQSSRTRNNTSGGASSGGTGGRTLIFSQDGRNVTPKSLVPSHFQQRESGPAGTSAPPAATSAALRGSGTGGVEGGSSTNAGAAAAASPDAPLSQGAEAESAALAAGEADAPQPLLPAPAPVPPPPDRIQRIKAAALSREELERNVDIVLAETETTTLISFPSLTVALDNPNYTRVVERNKAYDELCASKADSDQYREQHTQTQNHPHKSKEVFAAPPSTETVEVNANGWDIYDTFATDPVPKHEQIQQACEKESATAVAQAIKKPGCLFMMTEPYPSGEGSTEQTTKKPEDARRGQKTGKVKPAATHGGNFSGGTSAPIGASAGPSKLMNSTVESFGAGATGVGSALLGGDGEATLPSGMAAAAADASGAEDAKAEEAEEPAEAQLLTDAMPWRMGVDVPIPEELDQAVRIMERIVAQNVFHKQHMIYRNYPTLEELARLDELRAEEVGRDATGGDSVAGLSTELGASGRPGLGLGPGPHESSALGLSGSGAEAGGARGLGPGPGSGETGAGAGRRDATQEEQAEEQVQGVGGRGEGGLGEGDGDFGRDSAAREGRGEAEATGAPGQEGSAGGRPYLQDLFCFDAPQLTNGMTVTCAEWNRHNQDLLAVSYGDTTPVPTRQGGLVLFWSLKNPTYPERVIRTRHGVTALHFSSVHPNMVAAGTHEGSVMIWDLRRPSDTPVLRSGSSVSTHNDQKHTDIVWETRWVDQGPEKQPPELLVSVSSDGNVLQWSMKKGLEQMLLMQLKRFQNPHLGANSVYGHKEGVVFRKSSGFCVDFPRHDPSTYLVGTEDGLVHRCSTSYNEQYLDTYYGHSGPVYRVRCSPFMSHAFLTCSADWTVKLWTTKPVQGHQPDTPLLTFQSTDLYDAVNDVIWSPHISTSFAAAMDDGRVELWDLSEKPLDPIVVHYPQAHGPQRRRTCVRFSPNSPVLIAGDDRGSVDVMRMHHTNQSYYSDQEQQDRLSAVMVKKR